MNKFFGAAIIAMLILSFASCEKDKDDDYDSLVGTYWNAYTVIPETGVKAEMGIRFISMTTGIFNIHIEGNTGVNEITFSYYKDDSQWQIFLEDGSSFGRFTVRGSYLYWHRTNGTSLTFSKKSR